MGFPRPILVPDQQQVFTEPIKLLGGNVNLSMKKEKIINQVKAYIRLLLGMALGTHFRVHRIPFGPIKGRKLFMSPQISPRMWFGIDEPWIARLCETHLRQSDVVYDIGAHIGYTTVLFAHYLEGTGVVHAFEILPSTADFLRKTVEANDFRNVTIHGVGLGAEEVICELPISRTAMTSIRARQHEGQRSEGCRVVTLDKYMREHSLPLPALMKIDIEGAEIDCLTGSLELINECRPTMIIAFHSKDLLQQGYALLTSLDYQFHDERGPLTEDSIAEVSGCFNDSILCLPREGGHYRTRRDQMAGYSTTNT